MNYEGSGWCKILEKGMSSGCDVYVKAIHFPLYLKICRDHYKDYYLCNLYRALHALNSDPRSGKSINHPGSIRAITRDGLALEYYLENGCVFVHKLHVSHVLREPAASSSGLYKAQYAVASGRWVAEARPRLKMELRHKWGGAHYAAISGVFDNKDVAGMHLFGHISKSYGGKYFLAPQVEQDGKHYSLYWVQPGSHASQQCAEDVASLIQQAAQKGAPVHWLVQGEACRTYKHALKLLVDQPSLSRYAAQDSDAVRYAMASMALQKVVLSNPRGARPDEIEQLCERVGIQYEAANINPRDLLGSAVWRNSAKELGLIAASAAVFGGTVTALKRTGIEAAKSAGETLIQQINSAVNNPNFATIAGAAVTGIVAINASKSCFTQTHAAYRTLMAYAHSTFGRGNQFWYQNDEQLIKNLA